MKKLLNITLLLFVALSCKSQTIDETIELLRAQVNELENEIIVLADSNAKLLTALDSVINRDCEDVNTSHSLIRLWDTAYVYIEDNEGNSIEMHKMGSNINSQIKKGDLRLKNVWTDLEERKTGFYNGNENPATLVEDSLTYGASFSDAKLQIEKRK